MTGGRRGVLTRRFLFLVKLVSMHVGSEGGWFSVGNVTEILYEPVWAGVAFEIVSWEVVVPEYDPPSEM